MVLSADTVDIRHLALAALSPDPTNVRRHPDTNLQAICDSLQAFGQQKPIVVTQQGRILAGNGTYQAAQQLGWTHLWAQVSPLEGDRATAYALADNRTTDLSTWNEQMLADTLRTLAAQALPLPGWSKADLAALTPRPLVGIQEGEVDPDRGAVLREQYQVEPGQLWQCGVHRLLCADSLAPANLARLLQGEAVQMVWSDPPYGMNIVQTNGYVGGGEAYKAKHGEYAIQRDTRRGTDGAAKPFGKRSPGPKGQVGHHASNVVQVGKYSPVIGDESPETARQAATLYLATYPQAVQVWWGANYYVDALGPSQCWLVWDKEVSAHFADVELAWVNRERAARLLRHRWNGMLRASERERRWHPTQKPAALAAWAFELLGTEGDLVLDPFLGCGPSLMAAAQTGRRCYGLELSPEYIAVSLHRWATVTGQAPVRVEG